MRKEYVGPALHEKENIQDFHPSSCIKVGESVVMPLPIDIIQHVEEVRTWECDIKEK